MTTIRGAKYLWKLPPNDPQAIWSIAALYNLSYPIAHLLFTRGYTTKEAIDSLKVKTSKEIKLRIKLHFNS